MICEEKKKLIKERFYRGVQKQREKREGREIDRERYLLVIEDEPSKLSEDELELTVSKMLNQQQKLCKHQQQFFYQNPNTNTS